MNKKHILILSLILGALVLGVALKYMAAQREDSTSGDVSAPLSLSFDPVKVTKVLVGRGQRSVPIELVKEDGIWRVKNLWNARADEMKIKELLNELRNLKGELRSSDPAVMGDFGITDADAFLIKVSDGSGKMLADLRIGSRRPGYDGFFVRRSGRPEVYCVETDFDRLIGLYTAIEEARPLPDFWADLALFSLDPEKVTKITVSRLKEGAVTLSAGVERVEGEFPPAGGNWKLIGPKEKAPVDPEKVLRFIAALNSIKGQTVMDPSGKNYGLDKPVWRLSVIVDGKEIALEAGPQQSKDNVYFVRLAGRPEVFRLTAYFFEDLDIKNDKFIAQGVEGGADKKTSA